MQRQPPAHVTARLLHRHSRIQAKLPHSGKRCIQVSRSHHPGSEPRSNIQSGLMRTVIQREPSLLPGPETQVQARLGQSQ